MNTCSLPKENIPFAPSCAPKLTQHQITSCLIVALGPFCGPILITQNRFAQWARTL